jgi:uroporphyrinogen-III synthase
MDAAPKPLAGKRMVVTRAQEQAGELIRALEHLGAEVIHVPAVAFEFPEDFGPLDRALQELSRFDWVLFTSQNAVRFAASRLKRLGLPPATRRIAAVGPATAATATHEGFYVDCVATNRSAHSLAGELADQLAGQSVFLPHSDRSDPALAGALREAGARVTEAIAYRTTVPAPPSAEILSRLRNGDFDVAIFSSPSAFHSFDGFLGTGSLAALARRARFAAIGPTTAKAMHEAGVRVHIEAEEASPAGLADAIIKYFHEHSVSSRHS